MAKSTSVDTLLGGYPVNVQQLAETARRSIKKWLPGVDEQTDTSARQLWYSYAPGYKGAVCTIILSKTGIKLGLVGGATLPDPERLLAGAGKVHRYIAIAKPADLRQPGVKPLVLAASTACRTRLGQ